jgi:hypothetical protein
MSSETRKFRVNESIIEHLIHAQAGSLEKGVLEAVQNSHDAQATRIDIALQADTVTITDDGRGFATAEEIKQVFEEFSFDHGDGGGRQFGRFGLGRGQLFAFAATTWRSHGFQMDVDIRKNGLSYDLSEGLEDLPGTRIEAALYTALTPVDIYHITEAIGRMCLYATVPVHVNGKCVSKPDAKRNWTLETDDAWFALKDDSVSLKVYNQGLYVRDYMVSKTGCGGVVCTKPGCNLELNMARNDVLESRCRRWGRIMEVLKKAAGEKTHRKTRRLTIADRDYLASQTADPQHVGNFDQKLFTLSNNRNVSFGGLCRKITRCHDATLTVAETGDRIADRMMVTRAGVVLAPITLERFGAESVDDFLRIVGERAAHDPARRGRWQRACRHLRVIEDITQAPAYQMLDSTLIDDSALGAEEKHTIHALRAADTAWRIVAAHHPDGHRPASRKLVVGESNHAEAWTDGLTMIAIDQVLLRESAMDGLPGFQKLAHLLVHEYLHDDNDSGSHVHDAAFYEAAHEILVDGASELARIAASAFTRYINATERRARVLAKQETLISKSAA